MKTYKEWLFNEAAYTPSDIPDGVVVVRIKIANRDPYFYFADAETLQEIEEHENGWLISKPHGHIHINAMNDGTFRVNTVVASNGWGPLLHDLAMEYATINGKGLGPDYKENSPDSEGIWNYYYAKRNDVKKSPVNAPNKYKDWPAAHFLYKKKNEVTNEMLEAGLLIIKS